MMNFNDFIKINESEINIGTLTNKGKVQWIDTPYKSSGNYYDTSDSKWKHDDEKAGIESDPLVRTEKGLFRMSELSIVTENPTEEKKGSVSEFKPIIEFTDLMKVDIRVCEVKSASRIKGKDRLLSLLINTGSDERTVVTNIGNKYSPEDLIGKKFGFVLNLKKARIGGIDSNGMIIASDNAGDVSLVEIDSPVGSKLL